MKVTVKETAKCQKVMNIEVPPEAIVEEYERFYREMGKTAQVPGFRKGKAPRHVLEEHFADRAHEKVLSNLVSDNYYKALEQEKIKPLAMPQISNVDFKKDSKLTFQATIDVPPAFDLKDYKKIKIKREIVNINEEEVTKILGYLQERYAQFSPAEDRPTKVNDYVICNYSYSVDGKQIDKREGIWMEITEKMFIPGLSQEMTGVKAGTEKEFTLELPKDFQPAELAKKKADFKFSVKEIKEKKLPELNDEFAKMIGKDTLDALKNQIKEDLTKEKESSIKAEMKSQIIESLVKSMPIDVPENMVKEREHSLLESAKQKMKQQGMNEAQITEEEKKLAGLVQNEALKQIRTFFIFDKISVAEQINVSREDVEAKIDNIAKVHNQKKEDILKYFSDKKLMDNLQADIWEEKILSFLIANAEVTETGKKEENKSN